jgi:hypothetical protein
MTITTDTYRESWDIRSEDGSLCFARVIYSRLVGGEKDESTLQWLAQYLRANATPHHHQPPMTDQLRARLVELEAQYETQRRATLEWGKDVDNHGRWIDDHLKRIMALEQRPIPGTVELAAPTDSLVERVAQGIAAADDEGLTNMTWNYHARAAIREVAAWLRENDAECNMGGDAAQAAGLLEIQVNQ